MFKEESDKGVNVNVKNKKLIALVVLSFPFIVLGFVVATFKYGYRFGKLVSVLILE